MLPNYVAYNIQTGWIEDLAIKNLVYSRNVFTQ